MTKDLAGHPRCLRVRSATPRRCKFFLGNQSVPV
jgi:hypothetical protein